jgi:plastocyanin
MKKYVLSVLFFFGLIGFAKADIINVDVADFAFTPADVVCSVGDTIIWTESSGNHTTSSTSVPAGAVTWDYTFTGIGDSYSYIIEVPGDYTYQCNFHPAQMQGTIRAGYALPMVENFEYPAGDTLRNYGGWKNHSGTGTILLMTAGSLSYPGYTASGIGNSVTVNGGSGSREDVNKLFHQQSQGAVYAGFLVNVTAASTTGDYFFHFAPYFPTTLFRGRVFVKDDGAGNLQFGLSFASTSTVEYTTTTYTYGETYLLVLKYEYVNDATGSDDIAKLYINPVLTDPEPSTPDLQSTDTNTDVMVGAVALRQGANVYTVQVDGIKVSTLWNDIVPVELSSFTAVVNSNSVTLNWKTATETNNRGFEVQRKTSNTEWADISFVNGSGTSTQPHEYSYSDNNLQSTKYYYRLKQVDFNGSYEYSNVIEAEVNSPIKFDLAQNYPNPFNPTTKINYSVPSNGNVKLTVYNVLGQEIAVLVNGFMKLGNYTVDFNASNLNSGLYFYKLESNGSSLVKKMMLVK